MIVRLYHIGISYVLFTYNEMERDKPCITG